MKFTKLAIESNPSAEPARLVRVDRANPCEVCGKPDWCSAADNGAFAICMRVESDRAARNGGWVHRLEQGRTFEPRLVTVTQHYRAGIDARDAVYSDFITALELRDRDRITLHNRGLDDTTIRRNGYRSMPRLGETNLVMAALKDDDLSGIPGFYRRDGEWKLNLGASQDRYGQIRSFNQGLLIPIRDPEGRIEAFQIGRVDVRPGEPRYIWLSSSKQQDGAGSGAPIHFRNPGRIGERAILTEGALKADVTARLLGNRCGVIAIAGVQSFRSNLGERLRSEFPALRSITIAFDADYDRKPEVRAAFDRLKDSLERAGLQTERLVWPEARGKGIDDHLHNHPEWREKVLEMCGPDRIIQREIER